MSKKRRTAQRAAVWGLILLILLGATGCSGDKQENTIMDEAARKKNMESQEPVKPLMEDCGLAHLDLFWEMAMSKEDVKKKKQDANSRVIAFMLMENHILSGSKKTWGQELDPDIKLIETDENFEFLKDSVEKYSAVFDGVSVKGARSKEELADAYPAAWQQRGVTFDDSQAHLISIIMHDRRNKELYIGHAGVMLEDNEGFLFIEKTDSFKPFRISYFVNKQELEDKLLGRKEYIRDIKANTPFLMDNNKLFDPGD